MTQLIALGMVVVVALTVFACWSIHACLQSLRQQLAHAQDYQYQLTRVLALLKIAQANQRAHGAAIKGLGDLCSFMPPERPDEEPNDLPESKTSGVRITAGNIRATESNE